MYAFCEHLLILLTFPWPTFGFDLRLDILLCLIDIGQNIIKMIVIIICEKRLWFQELFIYDFANNGLLVCWNVNWIRIRVAAASVAVGVGPLVFHEVDLIHLFEFLSLFAVEELNDFTDI